MRVLVFAPHPDDEVLGLGGTLARLAREGHEVTIAIVTKGWAPLFSDEDVERVRSEAREASRCLGAHELLFMDLPVTKLNTLPKWEINGSFEEVVRTHEPTWVFLPFRDDLQEDHRQVFDAGMVALRPVLSSRFLRKIMCYETLSETDCNASGLVSTFAPQLWVDISDTLQTKLDVMRCYASQLQDEPSARTLAAVEALARLRGASLGMAAAECFSVVRESLPAP